MTSCGVATRRLCLATFMYVSVICDVIALCQNANSTIKQTCHSLAPIGETNFILNAVTLCVVFSKFVWQLTNKLLYAQNCITVFLLVLVLATAWVQGLLLPINNKSRDI